VASYDFEIGTSVGTLTNIEELDTPLPGPFSTYKRYQTLVDLGDLSARGFGRPTATWHWDFLTHAQRDQLKVYCADASAAIYIKTKKRHATEAYQVFSCKMIWPEEEDVQFEVVRDFTVVFRDLVEV
jgi:hypothetical protein